MARPGRTTVEVAGSVLGRQKARAHSKPRGDGRWDLRVGDELEATLTAYVDQMSVLPAAERLCHAGSLYRFPSIPRTLGRRPQGNQRLQDLPMQQDVLLDGTHRLYVPPRARPALNKAATYGLVLRHEFVVSGTDWARTHPSEARPPTVLWARPSIDALHTAEVLAGGPLTDEPISTLGVQLIKQSTAQLLWDAADRELHSRRPPLPPGGHWSFGGYVSEIRWTMKLLLPDLLGSAVQLRAVEQRLIDWEGTLTDLRAASSLKSSAS